VSNVLRGPIVDFVCQSNMGRADGGRETWAYQFIPALLERHRDLRLRLYGQRLEGSPDTTPDLVATVGPARGRFSAKFFLTKRSRWPLLFSMIARFARWKREEPEPTASVAIAAGCVAELLVILASAQARRAFKVAWLRTILMDSKAARIPVPLRPFARWLEARILACADLLIANGDDIADYYSRYGLQVHVIKNAVDLARWSLPPPALGHQIHVAYVGRLGLEKGFADFVQLARAMRDAPDRGAFVFDVIGGTGEEPLLKRAIEEESVVWHGTLTGDELKRAIEGVDVCVAFTFASSHVGGGGTSNAMMEQLAGGRVLLAWDNVIFRQWLSDANAYLVPQGDIAAAARALHEIAADRELARQRAERGREVVRGHDVPAMMSRYEQVLDAALALRS
jgi:glycosyltransferase involved in cell wall biosynthesis